MNKYFEVICGDSESVTLSHKLNMVKDSFTVIAIVKYTGSTVAYCEFHSPFIPSETKTKVIKPKDKQ